ncbi:unnamed protein product [Phytomonas sp. EM1]|nr:unnamed protein product [Phytomonas sp. EM1]|eukprot:CCW64172.1 unnamed protein product [Phytomonas sp. isolate EM1]
MNENSYAADAAQPLCQPTATHADVHNAEGNIAAPCPPNSFQPLAQSMEKGKVEGGFDNIYVSASYVAPYALSAAPYSPPGFAAMPPYAGEWQAPQCQPLNYPYSAAIAMPYNPQDWNWGQPPPSTVPCPTSSSGWGRAGAVSSPPGKDSRLTPFSLNAYAEMYCLLCGEEGHPYASCRLFNDKFVCFFNEHDSGVYIMTHNEWLTKARLSDVVEFVERTLHIPRSLCEIWLDGRSLGHQSGTAANSRNMMLSPKEMNMRCCELRLVPGAAVYVSGCGIWEPRQGGVFLRQRQRDYNPYPAAAEPPRGIPATEPLGIPADSTQPATWASQGECYVDPYSHPYNTAQSAEGGDENISAMTSAPPPSSATVDPSDTLESDAHVCPPNEAWQTYEPDCGDQGKVAEEEESATVCNNSGEIVPFLSASNSSTHSGPLLSQVSAKAHLLTSAVAAAGKQWMNIRRGVPQSFVNPFLPLAMRIHERQQQNHARAHRRKANKRRMPPKAAKPASTGSLAAVSDGVCDDDDAQRLERTIYVKFLPQEVDSFKLRQLFDEYGEVRKVRLVWPSASSQNSLADETERPFLVGFIEYASPEEADAALAGLQGRCLCDQFRLVVAKPKHAITGSHSSDYDVRVPKPCTFGLPSNVVEAVELSLGLRGSPLESPAPTLAASVDDKPEAGCEPPIHPSLVGNAVETNREPVDCSAPPSTRSVEEKGGNAAVEKKKEGGAPPTMGPARRDRMPRLPERNRGLLVDECWRSRIHFLRAQRVCENVREFAAQYAMRKLEPIYASALHHLYLALYFPPESSNEEDLVPIDTCGVNPTLPIDGPLPNPILLRLEMLTYEVALYIHHDQYKDGKRAAQSSQQVSELACRYVQMLSHEPVPGVQIENCWRELFTTSTSFAQYSPHRIHAAMVNSVVINNDPSECVDIPTMAANASDKTPFNGFFPRIEVAYCFLHRLLQHALLLDSYLSSDSGAVRLKIHHLNNMLAGIEVDNNLGDPSLSLDGLEYSDIEYIHRIQMLLIDVAQALYQQFKDFYNKKGTLVVSESALPTGDGNPACDSPGLPKQEPSVSASSILGSLIDDCSGGPGEAMFIKFLDTLMLERVPRCSVLMQNRGKAKLLNRLLPGVSRYPVEVLSNRIGCFIF